MSCTVVTKHYISQINVNVMVQTKSNQENVVVSKIYFHSKTKQNMKVGATKIQPDGSYKREIRQTGYN